MILIYALIYLMFAKLYGGLKVGYLKRIDVFYSLTLATICTNVVTYFQITLINRWFMSVRPVIEMTGVQLIVTVLWIWGSRYIYSRLYGARRLLVIYGDRDPGDVIHKMNTRKDKYDISGKVHIREGEVYGLLGPNGAGKSTTLKLNCGMLRPPAGEILCAGHAWRREDLYAIGSLIEEAPLYPNLTARENLRVRTTLLGLPESRVDEVLAAVGLSDTGKKRAGRFSMGMRQRLGLALALIARPRLLVLDEPTNGLDPIGIEELRDQIRGFAAAGTTVLVSSHILSEVQQMADTIGIIYGGRLAYEDALRPGQDLEELFMSVCREGRRARGEVAA